MDATLQILHTLRTFSGLNLEQPSRATTLSRYIFFIALGCAIINLLFIFFVTTFSIPLSPLAEKVVNTLYLLFWLIFILAMVVSLVPTLRTLIRALSPKNDFWITYDESVLIYPHKRQQAQTLNTLYPRENFQATILFLKAEISVNNARMSLFLGTNTSLIVLFGLIYAYQQKTDFFTLYLNGVFNNAIGTSFALGLLYLVAFSFLLGIALATFTCKILNGRYSYWLTLIDLALQLREDETRAAKEAAEKAASHVLAARTHRHPLPLTQRLRDAWRILRHG